MFFVIWLLLVVVWSGDDDEDMCVKKSVSFLLLYAEQLRKKMLSELDR